MLNYQRVYINHEISSLDLVPSTLLKTHLVQQGEQALEQAEQPWLQRRSQRVSHPLTNLEGEYRAPTEPKGFIDVPCSHWDYPTWIQWLNARITQLKSLGRWFGWFRNHFEKMVLFLVSGLIMTSETQKHLQKNDKSAASWTHASFHVLDHDFQGLIRTSEGSSSENHLIYIYSQLYNQLFLKSTRGYQQREYKSVISAFTARPCGVESASSATLTILLGNPGIEKCQASRRVWWNFFAVKKVAPLPYKRNFATSSA